MSSSLNRSDLSSFVFGSEIFNQWKFASYRFLNACTINRQCSILNKRGQCGQCDQNEFFLFSPPKYPFDWIVDSLWFFLRVPRRNRRSADRLIRPDITNFCFSDSGQQLYIEAVLFSFENIFFPLPPSPFSLLSLMKLSLSNWIIFFLLFFSSCWTKTVW